MTELHKYNDVYQAVLEGSREMRYRQRIADERTKGQENIRRMMREWRRELWPAYPDPIDRENMLRLVGALKKLGDSATSARVAFERARMTMLAAMPELPPIVVNDDGTWQRDLTNWRAGELIALSTTPPNFSTTVALVTSPA